MSEDTQTRRQVLVPDQVDLAVEILRMIAEPTRVRLLWGLLDREMSVNELAHEVGKPAPGVSQHLAKLRSARVVRTRQRANQVFYRIENSHVRQLIEDAISHAEHFAAAVPDHHGLDAHSRTAGS
jgi:DNA-binding transcriptional ArsR family regulator